MKSVLARLGILGLEVLLAATVYIGVDRPPPAATSCNFWVAPPPAGDNSHNGSRASPWATLRHAAATVPDNYCTVWIEDGLYDGQNRLNRRFQTPTLFKAVNPFQTIFEDYDTVLEISGATNITLEGMIFRHAGLGALPLVVQVDGSREGPAEYVTLRNNIFQDSYNNDLLKIVSGVRFLLVEGNVFYNQGPSDEHIDVNSVTDVVIQDNIFFNDFAGSGRENSQTAHSFITIKDSDEAIDGLLGSERISVRRNIFLNWEGGKETFIQIGNDGKPYHEAKDVQVENNLFIGNARNDAYAILGLRGVRDVVFANNTISGDLPTSAYAIWVDVKENNPVNENLFFYNNIWADPTGTMGSYTIGDDNEFSKGRPLYATNLVLDNNLYWNGDREIPGGDLLTPLVDDLRAIVGDPILNVDQTAILLPRWNGSAFLSGNVTIRDEFRRLVDLFGVVPDGSPAMSQGDPVYAPTDDILGNLRSATPELGAYEYQFLLAEQSAENAPDTVILSWNAPNEPAAVSLTLTYSIGSTPTRITGLSPIADTYTLQNLNPAGTYRMQLVAIDDQGGVLAATNMLELRLGTFQCLPIVMDQQVE